MAAPETMMLVVVDPAGRRYDPREVRVDIDDRDELREETIAAACRVSSYHTGSRSGGDWLRDWSAELFTEQEARKGTYPGGWAKPVKTLAFPR